MADHPVIEVEERIEQFLRTDKIFNPELKAVRLKLISNEMHIVLDVSDRGFNAFRRRVLKIAYFLAQVGFFSTILLCSDGGKKQSFLMQDLLMFLHSSSRIEGVIDRQLRKQQLRQDALRLRALIPVLTGAVFFINTRGVFQECHLNESLKHEYEPWMLEGQSIESLLPPDVAFNLMAQIRRVYQSGIGETVQQTIILGGSEHGAGQLIPVPGTNSVILLLNVRSIPV